MSSPPHHPSPAPQTPARQPAAQRPHAWVPPAWVPPVPVYPYAHWSRRFAAFALDTAPTGLAMIPFWVGYGLFYVQVGDLTSRGSVPLTQALLSEPLRPALLWSVTGLVLLLASLGWVGWNRWSTAGRTGRSWGKRVLRIALVAEVNGQPVGVGNAVLRDLLHLLDGLALVGLLRPLWDRKRQTFADKLMTTVVVADPVTPVAPPPDDRGRYAPYGAGS